MAQIKFKRGPSSNITSLILEQGEPAYTTDSKKLYIGNADGTKTLLNPDSSSITKEDIGLGDVENVRQASKSEFDAFKSATDSELARVEALAAGAARALVFDTEAQLDSWLAGTYTRPDGKVAADLRAGDNLLIIAKDVPDYWWDGAQKQELESDKVSTGDFMTAEQVQAAIDSKTQGFLSANSVIDGGTF